MTKKIAKEILVILDRLYPDAKAELDYKNPYELLVAVILSAQCTDVRVNMVTKVLFDEAPDAHELSKMSIERLEEIIKPCGLYKSKAKNLHETASILVNTFGGDVPKEHSELLTLPGVGQKTANVVVSNAFDTPAIAVDTHVFRVSNRIGLANAPNVEKTEIQLMKVIDRAFWTKAHHQLIFHGRRVCKARKPDCLNCSIKDYCKMYKKLSKESQRCKKTN